MQWFSLKKQRYSLILQQVGNCPKRRLLQTHKRNDAFLRNAIRPHNAQIKWEKKNFPYRNEKIFKDRQPLKMIMMSALYFFVSKNIINALCTEGKVRFKFLNRGLARQRRHLMRYLFHVCSSRFCPHKLRGTD